MNIHVRNARLRGVKEAIRVHRLIEARERIVKTDGQIDVFGTLAELDVTVIFKPLDGLLGAYLRQNSPGVLVSTKRPYAVQRFTGAHELGHAVMEHEPSLDSKGVLRRAAAGEFSSAPRAFKADLQEIEADAFAAEFLAPKWLVAHHARAQGWNVESFAIPDIAYQLSLRCGCSYEATVRSLEINRLLTSHRSKQLRNVKPKEIKGRVREGRELSDPWRDTWHLGVRDDAAAVPVAEGDLVRIDVAQHAATGFLWEMADAAVGVVALGEKVLLEDLVGGVGKKSFFLRLEAPGFAKIQLLEGRPWEVERHAVDLNLNVRAPEKGLSRANRARLAI